MDEFDIDSSLKKSIWQKMQRKRINTVLRQSHQNLLQNILNETKSSFKTSRWFDMGPDDDPIIDQSLRTEEMVLLALHPAPTPDSLSPALHEPGWHLCLDTPHDMKRMSSSILPVDVEGLVSQSFLSVCCSTGRQVASLLHPRHLRALSINIPSTFSNKASSLAESNPTYNQRDTTGLCCVLYLLLATSCNVFLSRVFCVRYIRCNLYRSSFGVGRRDTTGL